MLKISSFKVLINLLTAYNNINNKKNINNLVEMGRKINFCGHEKQANSKSFWCKIFKE